MKQLNIYKLVSKEDEDELVQITECKISSVVLPDWEEQYDDFDIVITSTDAGLTASITSETIEEYEIKQDDVAPICAELLQVIESIEEPEALPTYADRFTRLLGAEVKLESLAYLSKSPENVKEFLQSQL